MLTIGSTAMTKPGRRSKSPPRAELRADEIRHLRLFVHLTADAVADERLDHIEPIVANVTLHFGGHFAPSRLGGKHQFDRQFERPARAFEQPLRFGDTFPTGCVIAESPHQPPNLQPVSMLTTSPSFNARGPGMPWTTSSLTEMQELRGTELCRHAL
jgi:hypothetical protein